MIRSREDRKIKKHRRECLCWGLIRLSRFEVHAVINVAVIESNGMIRLTDLLNRVLFYQRSAKELCSLRESHDLAF